MKECVTSKEYMRIGDFAKKIGLSVSTVKRYEEEGVIKAHHKTRKSKQRYYTEQQVEEFIKNNQIVD
jgi:DNA-binding transcriptional MerR regulator